MRGHYSFTARALERRYSAGSNRIETHAKSVAHAAARPVSYPVTVNTICSTCGTTLQSGISRDFGKCGACRQAEEWRELAAAREAIPRAAAPPKTASTDAEAKRSGG